MSEFGHSTQEQAVSFAEQSGIDIAADMREHTPAWLSENVKLLKFDEEGATEQRIHETGADYLFSQLDYFLDYLGEDSIRASRMIAKIFAGQRTELAYWTEAAPTKELSVHQGEGTLIIGKPGDNETQPFNLDPEVTPTITLPSGRFYTFQAAPWTPEPLVVSGLYKANKPVDWDKMEIALEPGQTEVEMPDRIVSVPDEFRVLFESR